jgi:16S rRNA (guanine1207-N2)-methyltransferase
MASRLSTALAGALTSPDDGRFLWLRPPGDADLADLPRDRIVAVTGFRPDHDALHARGLTVAEAPQGDFAGAIVSLPRAKALAFDLIAQACATLSPGAPVIVDGAKSDGIESVLRACRAVFTVGEVVSKAHGKAFGFPAAPAPEGWAGRFATVDGFVTRPGVFSADGVDPGSAILTPHLGGLAGRVCDLGAGAGVLTRAVLTSEAVEAIDLVEAERVALDCARENVRDPRARFHWTDARRFQDGPYDVVVSNPPFHAGRRGDPDVGRAFVVAAARLLAPRGRLRMVANRHLPYEAALGEAFGSVVALEQRDGYKAIEATRPRREP